MRTDGSEPNVEVVHPEAGLTERTQTRTRLVPLPPLLGTKGVQDLEDKSAILSETLFPICNGKLVVAK